MTLKVPKGNGRQIPNTWECREPRSDNEQIIYICPGGHEIMIWHVRNRPEKNWNIAPDGKVTPSLECLMHETDLPECEGCRFHEFLELLDYTSSFIGYLVPPCQSAAPRFRFSQVNQEAPE